MITPQAIENFINENFPGYNKRYEEINFNSPFYPDKKKRLYVNLKSGKWFDQKLQQGGTFPSFVSEYLGISFKEACLVLESDCQSYSDIKSGVDIRDV